jgi:WD40 repeat protein
MLSDLYIRPVTGLEMLTETGHLLSCSLDGCLKVWNYTMGTVLKQFDHTQEIRCLAYRCVRCFKP